MNDITYMWNLKKYNKLVNITKKENHRYRGQKAAVTMTFSSGQRMNGEDITNNSTPCF